MIRGRDPPYVHKNYDRVTGFDDIAIIELERAGVVARRPIMFAYQGLAAPNQEEDRANRFIQILIWGFRREWPDGIETPYVSESYDPPVWVTRMVPPLTLELKRATMRIATTEYCSHAAHSFQKNVYAFLF